MNVAICKSNDYLIKSNTYSRFLSSVFFFSLNSFMKWECIDVVYTAQYYNFHEAWTEQLRFILKILIEKPRWIPIFILFYCAYKSGRSWRGVLYTTLCDKVCQELATERWFSPRVLRFPPPIKLSWNIVENNIKHHKP